MKHVISIYVLLLFFNLNNSAQSISSFSLFLDEDNLQMTKHTDENYTLGFGIRLQNNFFSNNCFANKIVDITDKIGKISKIKFFLPLSDTTLLIGKTGSMMLCGNGFTPSNINTSEIQKNDRPYSSLVNLTYSISRIYYASEKTKIIPRFTTIDVSLGIIGTKTSKYVQTKIHQQMNDNDTHSPFTPKGWGNQISKGGEPTFLIKNQVKYLLFSNSVNHLFKNKNKDCEISDPYRFFELSISREAYLGYYTGAAISCGGRLGLLDYRNWASNTINPLMNFVGYLFKPEYIRIREEFNTKRKFEIYFSSELKPTFMLYNAFLVGQFRKSVYTISYNDVNLFLYSWANSLCINIPMCHSNLNLVYNFYTFKSSEFKRTGNNGKSHEWGGIYLTWICFPTFDSN